MCISICAQPLPSHFRGGVQGWGYKSFVHKVYAYPTPALPLRWDYSLYTFV